MDVDWAGIETRLQAFWAALPPSSRLLSEWTTSRRFPEATYVREELVGSYKARKYLSLIPWLKEQGYRKVLVRGSSHSTNVTQLALALREQGIEPFYRMEGRGGPPAGNLLLARLVYGCEFKSPAAEVDFEIPEGGSCPPALAGSLGLAGSLVERALSHRTWKPEIYIDSGTAFSAAALLLGLAFFRLPCRVTIASMTGQNSEQILTVVNELREEYDRLLNSPSGLPEFEVVPPPVGPSFGSVPAAALAEIAETARLEGIFVDPIYSAKLGLLYKEKRDPKRPAVVFVSGGVRELLCFQGPLRKWLEAQV